MREEGTGGGGGEVTFGERDSIEIVEVLLCMV